MNIDISIMEKIYKIQIKSEFIINGKIHDRSYIGKTTLALKDLVIQKREEFDDYLNGGQKHKKIFDVIKDFEEEGTIKLLEKVQHEKILDRLQFWINNTNDCINTREHEMSKEEKLNAKNEKIKCDCGSIVSKRSLKKHVISQVHKSSMEGKKINNKQGKIYHQCKCGTKYLKSEKSRTAHIASKKHQEYENNA